MAGLLYETNYKINDKISIRIPTVGEVLKQEDEYFSIITIITAMPIDMMAQLHKAGIDFTTINEWELFCRMFSRLKEMDTSLVFGDLDLKDFCVSRDKENDTIVLYNAKKDIKIDRLTHAVIADFFRKLFHIEKNIKRPANEESKKYMIERAIKKYERQKRKTAPQSTLDNYIISLVNTAEFKYNYQSTLDLTIYQLYASLYQIIRKVKFDNLMIGWYTATVKTENIDQAELNWLSTNT